MIISFAWTTPALLAGAKNVTRRDWDGSYARQFRAGALVDAWDRSPRTRRGRKVATIRLTRDPWPQRTSLMGDEDFRQEGIAYLQEHGVAPPTMGSWAVWWDQWRLAGEVLYVVEFQLVDRVCVCGAVTPYPAGSWITWVGGGGIFRCCDTEILDPHTESSTPPGCRCRFGEVGVRETRDRPA